MVKMLTALMLILPSLMNAQVWDWGVQLGGVLNETGTAVAIDPQQNVWVIGTFEGEITIAGTTLMSRGGDDMILIKLDQTGQPIVAKRGGSASNDNPFHLITDNQGNVYIVGRYWDEADFGSSILTPNQGSQSALFLVKYDNNANLLWAKDIEGHGLKTGEKLLIDNDDNLRLAGYFGDSLFVEQTVIAGNGNLDAFFLKFDVSGNLLDAKSTGFYGDTRATAIGVDAQGNLYAGGHFTEEIHFAGDTIKTLSQGEDLFILKYDAFGNEEWIKKAGGVFEDYCSDLAVDNDGNIFLTGNFLGILNFGSTQLSTSGFNDDVFLARLDTDGNFEWAKSYGGTNLDFGTSLDLDGNLIKIGGYFFSATNFEGIQFSTTVNDTDGYLLSVQTNGLFESVEHIPGNNYDFIHSIAVATNGSVYLTGEFAGDLSLGSNIIVPEGNFDIFLLKTNGTLTKTADIFSNSSMTIVPNPVANQLIVYWPEFLREGHLTIVNISGVQVYSQKVSSLAGNRLTIDLSSIAAGVYTIVIRDKQKKWIKKFVRFSDMN